MKYWILIFIFQGFGNCADQFSRDFRRVFREVVQEASSNSGRSAFYKSAFLQMQKGGVLEESLHRLARLHGINSERRRDPVPLPGTYYLESIRKPYPSGVFTLVATKNSEIQTSFIELKKLVPVDFSNPPMVSLTAIAPSTSTTEMNSLTSSQPFTGTRVDIPATGEPMMESETVEIIKIEGNGPKNEVVYSLKNAPRDMLHMKYVIFHKKGLETWMTFSDKDSAKRWTKNRVHFRILPGSTKDTYYLATAKGYEFLGYLYQSGKKPVHVPFPYLELIQSYLEKVDSGDFDAAFEICEKWPYEFLPEIAKRLKKGEREFTLSRYAPEDQGFASVKLILDGQYFAEFSLWENDMGKIFIGDIE